ncbi:MAG: aminotransferase class IV [Candidatus Omnitrophota bacterium]
MQIAFLNNRFISLNKARVPILDRGFLYGDGVFETMRAYKGVVFRLEKHMNRLFRSLKLFELVPKMSKKKMQYMIYELLKKSRLKSAYIKVMVTRGISKGLLAPKRITAPTVAAYALTYRAPKKSIYGEGYKVLISRSSINEDSAVAGHKTLNYLQNILCRNEAEKRGFDDALLVNMKGYISESTSSNLFLIKRKKIYTPTLECGILPGITREEVIRIARFSGYSVCESPIREKALYDADEIFLTNSLTEIVPVVKVNDRVIADGKPGTDTKALMDLFKESVNEYCKR